MLAEGGWLSPRDDRARTHTAEWLRDLPGTAPRHLPSLLEPPAALGSPPFPDFAFPYFPRVRPPLEALGSLLHERPLPSPPVLYRLRPPWSSLAVTGARLQGTSSPWVPWFPGNGFQDKWMRAVGPPGTECEMPQLRRSGQPAPAWAHPLPSDRQSGIPGA